MGLVLLWRATSQRNGPGTFVSSQPFHFTPSVLGEAVEQAYWRRTGSYGRGLSTEAVTRAVREFLAVGRPSSALELMVLTSNEAGSLRPPTLLELVEAALATPSQEAGRGLDPYNLQALLKKMQKAPEVDEGRLARLEWLLLPNLDRHTLLPATLQKVLSRDPAFFVEMLTVLYHPRNRSEDSTPPPEPDPEKAQLAKRVYQLLRDWNRIPGTRDDGTVDPAALLAWVLEAREQAKVVDRLEVAEITIGQTLARAPGEPDGSWPCIAVRDALEATDSSRLEDGFTIGIMNLRGVTSRALDEGGQQERDQAVRYEKYAVACRGRWPRTEAVLLRVAADYRDQGRRQDADVERF